MTTANSSNIIFDIDDLVERLEDKGYEFQDVIAAMSEYVELSEELL